MKHSVPLDKSKEETNWATARRVGFPNLRPSSTAISLRLPSAILDRIKMEANKRGIPYQSYMKLVLAEKFGDSGGPRKKQKRAA